MNASSIDAFSTTVSSFSLNLEISRTPTKFPPRHHLAEDRKDLQAFPPIRIQADFVCPPIYIVPVPRLGVAVAVRRNMLHDQTWAELLRLDGIVHSAIRYWIKQRAHRLIPYARAG